MRTVDSITHAFQHGAKAFDYILANHEFPKSTVDLDRNSNSSGMAKQSKVTEHHLLDSRILFTEVDLTGAY